jgi:hypothetical protein
MQTGIRRRATARKEIGRTRACLVRLEEADRDDEGSRHHGREQPLELRPNLGCRAQVAHQERGRAHQCEEGDAQRIEDEQRRHRSGGQQLESDGVGWQARTKRSGLEHPDHRGRQDHEHEGQNRQAPGAPGQPTVGEQQHAREDHRHEPWPVSRAHHQQRPRRGRRAGVGHGFSAHGEPDQDSGRERGGQREQPANPMHLRADDDGRPGDPPGDRPGRGDKVVADRDGSTIEPAHREEDGCAGHGYGAGAGERQSIPPDSPVSGRHLREPRSHTDAPAGRTASSAVAISVELSV